MTFYDDYLNLSNLRTNITIKNKCNTQYNNSSKASITT